MAVPADPTAAPLADADAVRLLTHGELEIEGRLVDASNTTVRAVVTHDGVSARCVYKPVAGERPLWDFPDGTLAARERAAYLVSEATGWRLVPPTVLRDGPLGPGMAQLWIDEQCQSEQPLLGFVSARRLPAGWRWVADASDDGGRRFALAHADDPLLARIAVFDAVINNADRKGSHVIGTVDGRVLGVDHGVCFNTAPKLRTVLWGWAGHALPDEAAETLARLAAALEAELGGLLAAQLAAAEVRAVVDRVGELARTGRFPMPDPERWAIPWPPV